MTMNIYLKSRRKLSITQALQQWYIKLKLLKGGFDKAMSLGIRIGLIKKEEEKIKDLLLDLKLGESKLGKQTDE